MGLKRNIGTLTQTAARGLTLAPVLLSVWPLQLASAQDDSVFADYWSIYANVNYSSWDGLGDVEPVGRGGPFETSGVGIDLGGYLSIARLNSAWLIAGVEVGAIGFNSNVIFEEDLQSAKQESAFDVSHFTASMKARFGEPGERYFDVGVGLGQYYGNSKYIDCSVILSCFGADADDTAVGAFLELSGNVGGGFLLGGRVHYFEFDPIEAVDLAVSGFEGPIYSLFVGWEFSNWRRK